MRTKQDDETPFPVLPDGRAEPPEVPKSIGAGKDGSEKAEDVDRRSFNHNIRFYAELRAAYTSEHSQMRFVHKSWFKACSDNHTARISDIRNWLRPQGWDIKCERHTSGVGVYKKRDNRYYLVDHVLDRGAKKKQPNVAGADS